MVFAAALVVLASLALALVIWRGRERGQRADELDEALASVRHGLRAAVGWRRAVVAGGAIVALLLVVVLARNPSRWPLLLLALGVIAVAVAAVVLDARRRDG